MTRHPLVAALCLTLLTPGCSSGPEAARQPATRLASRPAEPAKKPPGEPVQARLQQTSLSPVPTTKACPDVPEAVYRAIEKPTALPREGTLDKEAVKAWVTDLEGQVKELRGELSTQVGLYNECRGGPLP